MTSRWLPRLASFFFGEPKIGRTSSQDTFGSLPHSFAKESIHVFLMAWCWALLTPIRIDRWVETPPPLSSAWSPSTATAAPPSPCKNNIVTLCHARRARANQRVCLILSMAQDESPRYRSSKHSRRWDHGLTSYIIHGQVASKCLRLPRLQRALA